MDRTRNLMIEWIPTPWRCDDDDDEDDDDDVDADPNDDDGDNGADDYDAQTPVSLLTLAMMMTMIRMVVIFTAKVWNTCLNAAPIQTSS